MATRLSRSALRSNRWWKHILYYLPEKVFGPDLRDLVEYDPNQWRAAFEKFQTHGRKDLSAAELYHIEPLIAAQRHKEVTLTTLAAESLEWWEKGWGWGWPWRAVLESKPCPDRLTRVAIMRTMKTISKDSLGFFQRHPGLSEEAKQRAFAAVASR